MFDVQNTIQRTGEVQALAQQAVYQAELAQKSLSQQLQKESREQPSQVRDLSQASASMATQDSDQRPRPAQRRPVSHPLKSSASPGQVFAVESKNHIDILI